MQPVRDWFQAHQQIRRFIAKETSPALAALHLTESEEPREGAMFSCDYNGWADVPEEEREAIEAFEAAQAVPSSPVSLPLPVKPLRVNTGSERRAA
jgi:hypothetical protein